MWKDFSLSYLKNNRSSGISVMVATFISALLLSLLCGLFYNAWKYEVERIELEEGGWHSRILGEFTPEDLETIKNFANVEDVERNKKGYQGTEPSVDLYFSDKRAVFTDTPLIARELGIPQDRIVYHYELLAMYLIRDSGDTAPRLLFPLFLLITLAASFSLIVIIHNSFAVSMNARIHQFGIFSSIGATPKQIRACLLQEAAALCTGPLLAGTLLGIAGSAGLLYLTNALLGNDVPGRHNAVFGYHPLILMLTMLVTVLTIWISAWLPARRLSKLTPLEAIKNTDELQLKSRKKSRLLALLFGVEGELAGNALKAQKKALRTASLSFLFSLLAFAVMQCVFTLSWISTRETYFERYQDAWDIMVMVKDTEADLLEEAAAIRELDDVESAIVYQKAAAKRIIAEEEISEEMKSFGGFAQAPAKDVKKVDGGYLVNVPIVILDDHSFQDFCEQIGIAPQLDGAVILNQIRDVTNPDFRHPVFMPYLKAAGADEKMVSLLRSSDPGSVSSGYIPMSVDGIGEITGEVFALANTAEVPVLAYTQEVPVLREEYAKLDYYELVHFIPASFWEKIKGQIGGMEADSYICIRCKGNVTLESLNVLQEEIASLFDGRYTIEQENRIQEYETNRTQIQGMMALLGGFCVLLAVIGMGNVFSNTLGFVRKRRREFARLMSVGLTPRELEKMFGIEAAVIAVKPVLISVPVVVIVIGFMLRMSYMDAGEFMTEAPFVPVLLFLFAIWVCVALAYCLAWRNLRRIDLAEVLRDDTML